MHKGILRAPPQGASYMNKCIYRCLGITSPIDDQLLRHLIDLTHNHASSPHCNRARPTPARRTTKLMFQLCCTNSVYSDNYMTSDTGGADDASERVALMLQSRHICSWVGDTLFVKQLLPRPSCCDIDSVQLQVFSTHRHPTTTTTTPFETDEAERHGRALLVL